MREPEMSHAFAIWDTNLVARPMHLRELSATRDFFVMSLWWQWLAVICQHNLCTVVSRATGQKLSVSLLRIISGASG